MLDTHPTLGAFFMGKYSKDFKLSAITAFLERGQGYRHIGARFGLDPTLLRRWVAAYQLHGEASLHGRRTGETYSAQFKLAVLQGMWAQNLSFRQAAAVFKLGSATQVGIWEQRYYSGGIEALIPRHRGSPALMTKPAAAPTLPAASAIKDEDLSHTELLAKLRKAQVEIAWLKKLKEYREEQQRQAVAAKKKPG